MREKTALSLIACIVLLFSMGVLMVYNTTAAEVIDRCLDCSFKHAFIKQMICALISLGCASLVCVIGFANVLRFSGVLLVIAILMLVGVFIPGLGQQINGANRWIRIFGYSFQPSEFVKYLLPLYLIHRVGRDHQGVNVMSFLHIALTLVLPVGLILVEPDNGAAAILLVTFFVLVILMRVRWIYWVVPLFVCTVCGAFFASQMPHVGRRIAVYLHPELDLRGKGHQPHQARIAAGSGGLLGRGFGQSLQKFNYLPAARSDYIAAIFAEEFGFVGILLLITLYMAIGGLGLMIAMRASTLQGFYLVAILTFLICFQAFLNLGVASGLLPSKGTNLPFFSHGGSSLITNCFALGLIISAARHEGSGVPHVD